MAVSNISNATIQHTYPETTVSVNLTSSQIQFLAQHLQVELVYLKAKIKETIEDKKPTPVNLIKRANKIQSILTNLGA